MGPGGRQQRADVAFYIEEAIKSGGNVLEVACGTGTLLELVLRWRELAPDRWVACHFADRPSFSPN